MTDPALFFSIWFNRRHRRAGHLFQGRFKAFVVEDDAGWQEVARYVHLNPVRLAGLGLGKRERAASRVGAVRAPGAELVVQRLRVLPEFRWSSYRAYAGYTPGVAWLWRDLVQRLCGGKNQQERREAVRQYTEQAVRQGQIEQPWDRLVAGLVLGTKAFARSLCRKAKGNAREQKELRKLAGGVDYTAVGQAVSRFGRRLEQQRELQRKVAETERQLSNVEM